MRRISEADRLMANRGGEVIGRYEAAINGVLDMVAEAQEALDAINAELDLPRGQFSGAVLLSKSIDLRNKARGILTLAEIIKRERPRDEAKSA